MRAAVLHVNTADARSTSPTMRIARFVAEEAKIPLVHDPWTADEVLRGGPLDVLFVKYGMLKFSDHREQALRIYEQARRVVNLENDYLFALDRRFRPPDEVWSTVEGRARYVNWNVITRLPLQTWRSPPPFVRPTKSGLYYYGAHRPDRVPSFVRYFRDAPYPVTISTFRGRAKFLETCGDKIEVTGAYRNPWTPAAWPLTVYLEDEASHQLYTSPAARFYECLQMGIAQVIDEKASQTFERAELPVPPEHLVSSKSGVRKMLGCWHEIRYMQRLCWWRRYDVELRGQFWAAHKASFGEKRRAS